MADLSDVIESLADGKIQRAESDGHSVQAIDLKDLIEADKYLSAKEAAKLPHRGIKFTKIIPPGTTS